MSNIDKQEKLRFQNDPYSTPEMRLHILEKNQLPETQHQITFFGSFQSNVQMKSILISNYFETRTFEVGLCVSGRSKFILEHLDFILSQALQEGITIFILSSTDSSSVKYG